MRVDRLVTLGIRQRGVDVRRQRRDSHPLCQWQHRPVEGQHPHTALSLLNHLGLCCGELAAGAVEQRQARACPDALPSDQRLPRIAGALSQQQDFHLPTSRLAGKEPGGNHPALVMHQQIAWA
jgi:hypothetical protein